MPKSWWTLIVSVINYDRCGGCTMWYGQYLSLGSWAINYKCYGFNNKSMHANIKMWICIGISISIFLIWNKIVKKKLLFIFF